MLEFADSEDPIGQSTVKLFSKYSNLCDDRIEGQTDGRTTCRITTALCVAPRGKNQLEIIGRRSIVTFSVLCRA